MSIIHRPTDNLPHKHRGRLLGKIEQELSWGLSAIFGWLALEVGTLIFPHPNAPGASHALILMLVLAYIHRVFKKRS
ncbi:hypothetical protein [Rhodanobacter sp. DHB23]|uniref:hypothetical protein n=1 Tax=Rhodanobacter sp. DHB23 TaxID=2775923 RepID=UPI0017860F97|nr:hypothetical protein [Rhodanobacter sp. DHB23]MBD8873532.1 hypothetical protein [Rhodanobacter sp. DHB23]